MAELWFTADTHFGHAAVLGHAKRPFTTTDDMNRALIAAWNARVGHADHVYHLGDFSFMKAGPTHAIIDALQGQIHLITGNHDHHMPAHVRERFASVHPYLELKLKSNAAMMVALCHYPFITWNKSHYGSWHFHGHSHGNLRQNIGNRDRRMDVGVDTHPELAPYNLDEIGQYMAKKRFESVDHHKERT